MGSERGITVIDALSGEFGPLIDVRSESEYAEASIPGAVNIPLLNDEERAKVGTLYRNEGVEAAKKAGLEYVVPKISGLVASIQAASKNGQAVLYCWRGGMRSRSIVSLLHAIGIHVVRLEGGYKAYRRHVNKLLEEELGTKKVVVLHGLTGVGKTDVLNRLAEMGLGAIDLEGLANNRGSVFGTIGMGAQPSQKMFEGLFAAKLIAYRAQPCIIVECESRRIGRIFLPEKLLQQMQVGCRILLYASPEERIKRLVKIYTEGQDKGHLRTAIERLANRLGKKKVAELTAKIDAEQVDEVAEFLLKDYYDPLYHYPSGSDSDFDFSVEVDNVERAAVEIRNFINTNFSGC